MSFKRTDITRLKSQIIFEIRHFLYCHDYLEVSTPLRLKTPALEDYIDAIESEECFLRTSPELHMKRLIAEGESKIYQIGYCYRKAEIGQFHRQEFTMLEWYEAGGDYKKVLQLLEEMLLTVSLKLEIKEKYFQQKWEILTVENAFQKYANISALDAIKKEQFEEILVSQIEPFLGIEKPTVLIDYPSCLNSLAKKHDDNSSLTERWELYLNGMEIANAYSELADPEEQLIRFQETQKLRFAQKRKVYEIDYSFIDSLKDLPATGGIAVGMERLFMFFLDLKDISEAFCYDEVDIL